MVFETGFLEMFYIPIKKNQHPLGPYPTPGGQDLNRLGYILSDGAFTKV